MSKPIQIAVAAAFDKDAGMMVIEEMVLCDDGRIFARDIGYDENTRWHELSGPWETR